MQTLVVVAHPVKASLCQSLATFVVQSLQDSGVLCDVIDLYQDEFDTELSQKERETYYSGYECQANNSYVEKLAKCENLVLIFPTWWFGFPAILKGWFDRVWGS